MGPMSMSESRKKDTDPGPAFQKMCVLLNINKTKTSQYHPEGDRLVVQMNQVLQDILALKVHVQIISMTAGMSNGCW